MTWTRIPGNGTVSDVSQVNQIIDGLTGATTDQPITVVQSQQTVTETALVSGVDPKAGTTVFCTLTANRVVGAPLSPVAGQRIHYIFAENGTGGWTLTFNAVFSITNWALNTAANARTELMVEYDGTAAKWVVASNPPTGNVLAWGKDSGYNLKSPVNPSGAAKFDGVTNDTASWTAAITAAQSTAADAATTGGIIIVPPGVSIQNAALTGTVPGVTFKGFGKRVSVLKRANATNQVQVQLNTGATDWTFESMGFDQNGQNQTSNWHSVSMLWTTDNVTVQHCAFLNIEGFAVFVNFDAATHRVNNLRVLFNDFVQFATAAHDCMSLASKGGGAIGNRAILHGTGSGFDVYEALDFPVTGNSILLNGDGGFGISLMSCNDCPAVGNTINAGGNDVGFWLRKETDNAFANPSSATLVSSNTFRSGGGNTFARVEGASNVKIVANMVDGTLNFINLNVGPISAIHAEHNTLLNYTNFTNGGITPTANVYRDNVGFNPQGALLVTPTASPWTYTAGFTPEVLYLVAGTVSLIVKNGITLGTGTSATVPLPIPLQPGEAVTVTYSVVPTANTDRK